MMRSVRVRLTVWYVSILAGILSLFGWILYSNVKTGLARDVDRALTFQAGTVAQSIIAFWEAERSAPGSAPGNWAGAPTRSLGDAANQGRLPALVVRWAQRVQALDSRQVLCVMDQNGRIMAASTGFVHPPPALMEYAVSEARRGRTVYNTFEDPEHGRIRVVTRPVTESGRVLYLVQLAASLAQADASLGRLRLWLWWLIPSTLVVVSSVGWLLVRQALLPVGQMTARAQQISGEHLSERVPVPRSRDEMERLARTFNEMLDRLERAFRQLRQFSAAASHELRTPLTVMKGELEVTLRRPRSTEEYRQVLRTHLETVDQMTETVEVLLMLGRSEAVRGALELRPLEFSQLVQQAIGVWRTLAQKRGVSVECRAGSVVWVSGERRLLERVVANLLDNAIRHTPEGGMVTVLMIEDPGHEVRLAVRDTGPGILPETLSRIFDRFFQPWTNADGTTSTGVGLGLCRWIVEAHHGRILVESPPGQGATFTVLLPRIPVPA